MKLDRVDVKNFRSIQEITVKFDPPCRILVGINESGKSNILKALRLLSDDFNPTNKDDLRDPLPNEREIDESYVRVVFRFEKNESDKLLEQASSMILSSAKNPDIVSLEGQKQSLKAFCVQRNEGLYTVNILKETKSSGYWKIDQRYELLSGWKRVTELCPPDFSIEANGQKHTPSKYKLIRSADFPGIPPEYLAEAELDDLAKLVGSLIVKITEESLPDVLVWTYDAKNLLPSSVNIAAFATNPDSCVPLKNMFVLAGIDDIGASIEKARKGTINQFQNYLNRIAKKTTSHFRGVWREYKNIEFSLDLNSDQIIPGVKEKNTHDFARRSDGFNRFVTFLLMISIKVKTGDLHDSVLLIDEPDTSLHPSGARYLRDELITISRTNYVVYSTHSIFMIDPGDIDRHYIVKKKDEITTIRSAGGSNIADEEVLYNALGHSVFAILKKKNLIFEGWKDKHLFEVALADSSAELKRKYKDIGICHARGARNIKAITPMIELARRQCLIVSDSDAPAKEQQKIYKQDKGYGMWKNYQQIDSTIQAITGEDFVRNDFIVRQINSVLSRSAMPPFDQRLLPQKKGKLAVIFKWLTDNGMTTGQAKDTITQIKNAIFEKLKHQNIEDTYTKLLRGISI